MKAIILVMMIGMQLNACSKNESPAQADTPDASSSTTKIKITVGTTVFTATLFDNPSATAFKARLPLTINMTELNGNEKYYDFPSALPTNASVGGDMKAGDLMLYRSNVLVLFYKNFNTPYSYTKLGYVDNPNGLAQALGAGNVIVKFENN
ncbi:cyclophilin-like fold protein [Pedobacter sp. 22163]|uniref:cyclophilin-like fold protein n=1 Tax=Pedobacter sp. 22163 TaxID=3453883 RepID=UPI003F831F49